MVGMVKTQVVFPQDVLEELDRIVTPRKRSEFIVEATLARVRKERFLKALDRAYGAWTDENHPDLKTKEDVVAYVRRIRDNFFVRDRASRRAVRKRR